MSIKAKNPFILVFSNKYYVAIAVSVAVLFWVLLNILDQLLFFWPALLFYLPSEKMLSFTVSTLTSATIGVVASMNIYHIMNSKRVNTSALPGASFAVATCACAGCSTVGLSLLPILGSAGAIGIAFFAQYQEFLRLISLGILYWSLFSIYRQIIKGSVNMSNARS